MSNPLLEKLSDEDLAALANNNLDGVSDEGLKILSQQQDSEPVVEEQPKEEVSQVESAVRGFSQGITYNFAEEAEAAVKSSMNGSEYNDELIKAREADDAARADNPWTYGIGAFAGGVVSPISKLGFGAGFAKNVATASAQGGLAMFGATNDKFSTDGVKDTLIGAALGGGTSAALQGAFHGIKTASESFRNKFFAGGTKALRKTAEAHFNKTNQGINDYVQSLDDIRVSGIDEAGKPVQKKLIEVGNDYLDVKDKVEMALTNKNNDKLQYLYNIDDTVKFDKNDANRFYNGVLDQLDEISRGTNDEKILTEYANVRSRIVKSFTDIVKDKDGLAIEETIINELGKKEKVPVRALKEDLTKPSKIYKLMQDFNKSAFNDASMSASQKQTLKNITNYMNDGLDDIISSSKDVKGDVLKGFHKVRTDIANLLHFRNVIDDSIVSQQHGGMGMARDLMWGSMAFTASQVAGLGAFGTYGAVIAGLKAVSKVPEVDVGTSLLLTKLATRMESLGSGAKNIAQRIQAAAQISAAEFQKVTQAEYAKLELENEPLGRSVREVINRQDEILFIANSVNPKFASQLKEAIDDGNEDFIARSMDQISKLPGSAKYFQEGLGFNGMLYSDEDKIAAAEMIVSTDVSQQQKAMHMKQLRKPGPVKAPVLQQEEDPVSIFIKQQANKPRKPEY